MSKKMSSIIKSIVLIVIFLIGTYFCYNRFAYIHDNFCCTGMAQCPLLVCSSESTKLVEFEIFGFLVFFCGAGVLFEAIRLIKTVLKEERRSSRRS